MFFLIFSFICAFSPTANSFNPSDVIHHLDSFLEINNDLLFMENDYSYDEATSQNCFVSTVEPDIYFPLPVISSASESCEIACSKEGFACNPEMQLELDTSPSICAAGAQLAIGDIAIRAPRRMPLGEPVGCIIRADSSASLINISQNPSAMSQNPSAMSQNHCLSTGGRPSADYRRLCACNAFSGNNFQIEKSLDVQRTPILSGLELKTAMSGTTCEESCYSSSPGLVCNDVYQHILDYNLAICGAAVLNSKLPRMFHTENVVRGPVSGHFGSGDPHGCIVGVGTRKSREFEDDVLVVAINKRQHPGSGTGCRADSGNVESSINLTNKVCACVKKYF